MNAEWVDHLNLRIPADRVDEFVELYRDNLGFDLEHLDAYRNDEKPFFYLRLTETSVFHVSPREESFDGPSGENFNHVAIFVDEPRSAVRKRLEDSDAEIREEATRLGATGEYPSVYAEDPFGYVIEFKSRTEN